MFQQHDYNDHLCAGQLQDGVHYLRCSQVILIKIPHTSIDIAIFTAISKYLNFIPKITIMNDIVQVLLRYNNHQDSYAPDGSCRGMINVLFVQKLPSKLEYVFLRFFCSFCFYVTTMQLASDTLLKWQFPNQALLFFNTDCCTRIL